MRFLKPVLKPRCSFLNPFFLTFTITTSPAYFYANFYGAGKLERKGERERDRRIGLLPCEETTEERSRALRSRKGGERRRRRRRARAPDKQRTRCCRRREKKEQRGEEKAETKAKLERKKRKRAHKTFTNTNTEPLFPSLYPPD